MSFRDSKNIPKSWEIKRIKDIGKVKGGSTPSTKKEEYWNGEIPWITPKDLSDHNSVYISSGERSITKKGFENSSTHLLPKKSILFSSRAPIGYIAIAQKELCTNQGFKSIIPNDNMDYMFLYYLLKHNTNYIERMANGSTFSEISGSRLEKIELLLPPLKEQKKIANIFSTLDKKIENNNRMNKTLEKMAQAMYKSWFVDFEPFQDEEFVKSELGMIPKGWKVIKLKEIVSLKNGKRPNEKNENPQKNFKVPVIGASGVMAYTEESLYDEPILVVGRVGTLGVVQRYNSHCWTSDNTIVIKSDFYEYVYQILKTINFKSLNRGSTQPLIAQKDIKSQKVVFPPKNILKEFSDIVSKLFEKVKNNKRENQTLKKLRDSLLPKLMSGEIRVPLEKGKKEVN